MPLLELDKITATYRDGADEARVLDGVDLVLRRGETTSLVGKSGSGKSTLLGVIAGVLRPATGSIVFDGADVTALNEAGWGLLRARRIGCVLQSGNLIPFLTAAENVELAMQFSNRAGRVGRVGRAIELLGELGLADRRDHLPRHLSGGEAQRVAVAMALANEPDLLLADEVTGELDSTNADAVMEIIFDAADHRGLTVLFVTHSDELAGRAHHRLRLVDGRVVAT
jgi:putative ABC transport system ATP-binding protein